MVYVSFLDVLLTSDQFASLFQMFRHFVLREAALIHWKLPVS